MNKKITENKEEVNNDFILFKLTHEVDHLNETVEMLKEGLKQQCDINAKLLKIMKGE